MNKQCYLCGVTLIKNRNKSKDHVPPDCIYPDNKPLNLITIPCCRDCNKEYELLDEKMRNFISIIAGEKSSNAGEKAKKEVLRSSKLSNQFFSYTKPHPSLVDDNGNPRLLFYFKDDELNKWLIRVVKGLYFYRYKVRIDERSNFKVKSHPELSPQPSETFPMEEGLKLRPYFVYGDDNKLDSYCWILIFYDHLIFTVTVDIPRPRR